ncbi:MAG: hypothetical protein F6K58_18950 [Symploca sp. SIO2E9]|nr:hypothetical protein [Symploca sp. SIO2E9]
MKRIFGFLLALLAVVTFAVPIAHAEPQTVLLSKTGQLSEIPAKTAEQVVGFNVLERVLGKNYCQTYYVANPPLVGITQPVENPCPLGIQDIPEYQVDYKKAVSLFHQTNCGDAFESISLAWPLTPQVTEPIWKLRSNLDATVIIGADTGKVDCK